MISALPRPLLLLLFCTLLPLPGLAEETASRTEDAVRVDLHRNRGLRVRAFDGDLDLRFGGRLHLDTGYVDEDTSPQDDTFLVRRGRVHAKGRIYRDYRFVIDYETTGRLGGWRNLYAGYYGIDQMMLRVGNTIAPMGLSQAGSSNFTTFAERALPDLLMPGYQTGGMVRTWGEVPGLRRGHWNFSLGGFVEPLNKADNDFHSSDHASFSARGVIAPIARRTRVLHLGGSLEYRAINDGSDFRYRYRAESALLSTTLGTPRLSDVDDVLTWGVEALGMYRAWSFQGEYVRAEVDRRNNLDPVFDGYYIEGSWLLTGEHRRYSRTTGAFGRIRPKHVLGALQLGLRYSAVDLIDAGIQGGRAKNITAGLTWYPIQNVRAMFNFIKVDSRQRITGVRDEPYVYQVRLQVYL